MIYTIKTGDMIQKTFRLPRINVFDWQFQFEQVQLTRDLRDETKLYQGIRLPCKND